MLGMWVFLLGRLAFEADPQGLEHRQLVRRDHIGRGAIDRAITGEDELHYLGSCDHRDGGELEQRLGRLDLAALEVETLGLAGAKQLLNLPALAIPGDNLQRLRNSGNGVSSQKAPVDRLFDGGIELPHLDQAQGQLTRGVVVAAVGRALDGHVAKAQRYIGRAGWTARLRSNFQSEAMPDRPSLGNLKQPTAIHQGAIATGAREQMGMFVRNPVKLFVNIALPVADHRDHRRCSKRPLGTRRPLYPTIGFLLFDRLVAVIGRRRPLARPDLHPGQPEQGSAVCSNRQHGMHEQAWINPVAGWPKPVDSAGMLGIVQFRRVLDRKHMQARDTL